MLVLLLVVGCADNGRTRRLILGIESLPMDAPEEVAIVPIAEAVEYQTIVVEPPRKQVNRKKTYRKKKR